VGQAHPQALIYNITVAAKSSSAKRNEAASEIMAGMKRHSAVLVAEAELVSQELIRSAILWHEIWWEAITAGSELFFGEKNINGFIDTVMPCHQQMEARMGSQRTHQMGSSQNYGLGADASAREVSFFQGFGRDLQAALEWVREYQTSGVYDALNQAWEIYYQVYRRLGNMNAALTELDFHHVAPKLVEVQDLQLAIPGTYEAGVPPVRIASFKREIVVMTSKQKPRRIGIMGSDGKKHGFLLKGKEDLRQDERVMQVFDLVNALFSQDNHTKNLGITVYSVLPLSPQVGLVGWVENTDTLHGLIKDYRDARNIPLNIEHRLMLQMAPSLDKLMMMQKLEVFESALQKTQGLDLAKVLWLKSQNAEVWLDRRRNYTRSLAVMSMVGYILGLGDRHPSNLMLHKVSGKIVHIDFGDCFEVAMERDKVPEKVPFRLTRMLVNAMEVSGIEGNYRSTCELVMGKLRDNSDSMMAILEAFVHDPLMFWTLLDNGDEKGGDEKGGNSNARNDDGDDDDDSDSDNDIGSSTRPSAGGIGEGEEDKGALAERDQHVLPLEIRSMRRTSEEMVNIHAASLLKMEKDKEGGVDVASASAYAAASNQINERAVKVITRVHAKLCGRDFGSAIPVEDQVQRLIAQSTSHENLCQGWIGWCPLW
jgi:FKBP12-rapamycin complex-associated protein